MSKLEELFVEYEELKNELQSFRDFVKLVKCYFIEITNFYDLIYLERQILNYLNFFERKEKARKESHCDN